MRKGALRWDEMMLAEHAARQSRWAPATERAKADAEIRLPTSLGLSCASDYRGVGAAATERLSDAASSPYPLVTLCRAAGLPEPIPEYKFHPLRKWRADYCWPIHKVIVEIEGGAWSQGRHTRGAGFIADMAKYNAAALLGYAVLRYTPQQLGDAMRDLRIMLAR
jgi:hypothetical protein